ncbi:Butyryl-CoA dehydrogenase [Pseudomonas sessilinigenes]|nr:Butyryl-CoA dehydrogenase [Pseudomonas sessilinigenes]
MALLIPASAGGLGASALDAVHVQCALGARAPSLAVASTMHQFSVASLVLAAAGDATQGLLLRAIAEQRLLLASGFAEGVPGRGILDSGMQAESADGGVYLTGCKKPCSLATSMDLLTASYLRETQTGDELMIALIPANTPGISLHAYWSNPALAGAQSDELRLDRVFVPNRLSVCAGPREILEPLQLAGFVWFELLISAAYLGICAGLVEQVVDGARWSEADRVDLGCELQLGLAALQGLARELDADGALAGDLLARLLLVRYGLERSLARVSDRAHEALGGMRFIASGDASIRLLSARGLCFHPPARIAMRTALDAYLRGGAFNLT